MANACSSLVFPPSTSILSTFTARILAFFLTMIPATDIETPTSAETLYHRRSSEIWSDGYHDQKKADSESSQGLLLKSQNLAPLKKKFSFKNFVGISILFLILLNAIQSVLIMSMGYRSRKSCLASPGNYFPHLSTKYGLVSGFIMILIAYDLNRNPGAQSRALCNPSNH